MMNSLVAAHCLQGRQRPQFAEAEVEDRYYRSHESRRHLLSFVPLAAVVGVVAFVLEIATR